ncbi:MAG: CDP-diacylglycerol--glycerol-3-phosphate 3-phosphatidyltransferase, partial [Erysipelotrichaceae bacterium]|nr:CDP-diacylglycerol--glycerol-3-phosphate 3-phosphatidyltransferase [Erysipelotrichaceae bacterium]
SITLGIVSIPVTNLIVLILFAIASFTDFLDGFLARKNNQVTSFGAFIDPIADKALTTTLFILLTQSRIIPVLPVLIMVWRDIIVDGIRMIAAQKGKVMSAGMLGKIKTVSQMFCIIFTLLNNFPFEIAHIPFATFLLWFSTVISILGGIDYFNHAKDIILESK